MAKRLREHVKYTIKELDQYAQTEGSCVRKVNTNLHLSMGPFCLADFKHVLMAHIVRSKVGFYDVHLEGIVLDVKNVKILGTTGAMRADDPRIHVNVNADVYLFKPTEGAELSGIVKHIGAHHVGVVLYRVFNANLRVCHKVDKEEVQMDQSVKFRIRNYNLQNVFPYIEGELLTATGEVVKTKGKKIAFKDNDNADSGIEEKEQVQEFDELMSIIKEERPDDYESEDFTKNALKQSVSMDSSDSGTSAKKSKKKRVQDHELLSVIKSEKPDDYENVSLTSKSPKKSKKHSENMESNDSATSVKKSKKHRKSSLTLTSDSTDSGPQLTPKKIKKELEHSGDEQAQGAVKKAKKEKSSKAKTKSSPAKVVIVKQEELDTDDD